MNKLFLFIFCYIPLVMNAHEKCANWLSSIKQPDVQSNFINSHNSIVDPTDGIINEYTEVTNFDPCSNQITVKDATKYNPGDTVLIIQMKGADIDSSNTPYFGNITNYNHSGNYEFNIINFKNGNTITLLNTVKRAYDIPKGRVQLIRVPFFKNLNLYSTLTCLPWDGTKGGVLVFNVEGNITMHSDIDVSARGFRRGAIMQNPLVSMNMQDYYYDPASNNGAQKGEGIHEISKNKNYGRGAPSNGGGGGNAHNAGGGGGGNGGKGGHGGNQWETGMTISENIGGLGGNALNTSSSLNRLYLGGSGGMGHANDFDEYPSGNGGGIIILQAGSLTGNNFSIKANGENATEATVVAECNDGMGGGGGGGSILLNIPIIIGSISVEAKGGKGADHIAKDALYGPGGGGGGGLIALSQTITPAQYSPDLNGGINGVNVYHSRNPWGATSGDDGVLLNSFIPAIDKEIFKSNIDSIRISHSVSNCYKFDFKGLAYPAQVPISKWNWNLGDAFSSNSQNISYTYPSNGIYNIKIIATDMRGCSDSFLTKVTVNDLNISKSHDTTICGIQPVPIFASGGSVYTWSPSNTLDNSTSATPVATPISSTKYYVTVKDINGCIKKDSVQITLKPSPAIVKSNDTSICKNTEAYLFVKGGATFSWSPSTSLNDSHIANPVASPESGTTYNVKIVTDDGCATETSIKVGIKPIPDFTISPDSTICSNAKIQMFIAGGNSYEWSPSSTLDNPASQSPIASPFATTIYHVKITDANSCTYRDSVKISIREAASFSVSPDKTVCSGIPQQLNASGGDSYLWTPASFLDNSQSSSPVATSGSSVQFSVTIKKNVCNETATLFTTLTVLPLPSIKVSKTNDISCKLIYSHLSATGAIKFLWTPAEHLNNQKSPNPIASPKITTTYSVIGEDQNGCTNSDTISVKVDFDNNLFYGVPNSFTPNGDGVNDCFGIRSWGQVDQLDFSIYNRLGERVFYSDNPANCWDGRYKGNPQDADIFVYIISAKTNCGKIDRKGTVQLLR